MNGSQTEVHAELARSGDCLAEPARPLYLAPSLRGALCQHGNDWMHWTTRRANGPT
ncbi:hypothetical protein L227DRAFT_152747 [Lentinus tigrinus ALCF2SS1-6]|uniref:Uncharacterized protein n=1 Tax=Lentinus tigrinus ALCF2SS1-6 TaxID=1328759 RepID=A0A5C2SE44_9APHY|nr:hypothetical protein L227DRAFT_152747 [Lentinus tigrinus ALCF2SS1-6]